MELKSCCFMKACMAKGLRMSGRLLNVDDLPFRAEGTMAQNLAFGKTCLVLEVALLLLSPDSEQYLQQRRLK